jgi:hypothetical protein
LINICLDTSFVNSGYISNMKVTTVLDQGFDETVVRRTGTPLKVYGIRHEGPVFQDPHGSQKVTPNSSISDSYLLNWIQIHAY